MEEMYILNPDSAEEHGIPHEDIDHERVEGFSAFLTSVLG